MMQDNKFKDRYNINIINTLILIIKNMKVHESKLHQIHQIDSIYLGQLNSSYQKDGFGIQQTF